MTARAHPEVPFRVARQHAPVSVRCAFCISVGCQAGASWSSAYWNLVVGHYGAEDTDAGYSASTTFATIDSIVYCPTT